MGSTPGSASVAKSFAKPTDSADWRLYAYRTMTWRIPQKEYEHARSDSTRSFYAWEYDESDESLLMKYIVNS